MSIGLKGGAEVKEPVRATPARWSRCGGDSAKAVDNEDVRENKITELRENAWAMPTQTPSGATLGASASVLLQKEQHSASQCHSVRRRVGHSPAPGLSTFRSIPQPLESTFICCIQLNVNVSQTGLCLQCGEPCGV